jgi:GST-like protein
LCAQQTEIDLVFEMSVFTSGSFRNSEARKHTRRRSDIGKKGATDRLDPHPTAPWEIAMIKVYYSPGPDGAAVMLFLEEAGLPYQLHIIDFAKGGRNSRQSISISPFGQTPAIVDRSAGTDQSPVTLFGSDAILLYFAETTMQFSPHDLGGRAAVRLWLFWQLGGLRPVTGWHPHASRDVPAGERSAGRVYATQVDDLYRNLNQRLAKCRYLAGEDYTIADMAIYPWIAWWTNGLRFRDCSHLERWIEEIRLRPATARAYSDSRLHLIAPHLA